MSSTGGTSVEGRIVGLRVGGSESAGRWEGAEFMGREAGSSCMTTGVGSPFRPRRKPGNELSRFGEVGRAKPSSIKGSTFSF